MKGGVGGRQWRDTAGEGEGEGEVRKEVRKMALMMKLPPQ